MAEVLDPRQAKFLTNYLDPNSKTYSNIYQSALDAGYSESYADNMRAKSLKWVSGNVGEVTKDKLVSKAKRVLDKSLDSPDEKIAQDTAKFVAKTDSEFSEKQDLNVKGVGVTLSAEQAEQLIRARANRSDT